MTEQPNKEEHPRPQAGDGRATGSDEPERRSHHRVQDDQKTGQGSQSALSKLKMIERKRAAMRLRPQD